MKCWACDRPIMLADPVAVFAIVNALVHRGCYTRETGQRPSHNLTLADYLRVDRAAA